MRISQSKGHEMPLAVYRSAGQRRILNPDKAKLVAEWLQRRQYTRSAYAEAIATWPSPLPR